MADKNIQMTQRNTANNGWDNLFPKTIGSQVTTADGATLETFKGDFNAHKTDNTQHIDYVISTGSANTYAVTLSPAPTAYTEGMAVCVKINVESTGASTLNVNSLGAKTILDSSGKPITSGGLKAGLPYTLRYNGTNFIVQGKGGGYGPGDNIKNAKQIITTIISIFGDPGIEQGIVVDSQGNIYVFGQTSTIKKYNSSGGLLWSYSYSGLTFSYPVLDSDDNLYWGVSGNKVYKLPAGANPNTTAPTVLFTATGVTIGALKIASNGDVIIGGYDSSKTKVFIYNSSGTLLYSYELLSSGHKVLLAYDVNNDVIYASTDDHNIYKVIHSTGAGSVFATLTTMANALACNNSGNLYVYSKDTSRLKCYNTNGNLLWGDNDLWYNDSTSEILIDSEDNIYIHVSGYQSIVDSKLVTYRKYTKDGILLWEKVTTSKSPNYAAIDNDGYVYMTAPSDLVKCFTGINIIS